MKTKIVQLRRIGHKERIDDVDSSKQIKTQVGKRSVGRRRARSIKEDIKQIEKRLENQNTNQRKKTNLIQQAKCHPELWSQ